MAEESISVAEFVKSLADTKKITNEISKLLLSDLVSKYGCQLTQGVELWENAIRSTSIISTTCAEINKLLDGGIFTGELTEIFGPPASGKTQFAFNIIANVLLSNSLNILYYDGCGSFSSKRIHEMINVQKENNITSPITLKEMFSKLCCVKVFDIFDFISHLESIKGKLEIGTDQFVLQMKLIIVDSINSIVTPILGGRQNQGHSLMIKVSLILKELAYVYGIAVIVINGTVGSKVNADSLGSKFKPALGKHWLVVPHVRLFIDFASKENINLRSMTIYKHVRLPVATSKAFFQIEQSGLTCGTHTKAF